MNFFESTKQSTFEFVIRELSVSGFQYGHRFSQWNSLCIPNYLFLYYSVSYISYNLFLTFTFLRKTILFLRQISGRGASLLFAEGHHFFLVKNLGNSLLRKGIISGFLSFNWLGGTLTNWFNLVKKTIKRIRLFRTIKNLKIFNYVSGISHLHFLPNTLFLFSITTSPTALLEANRLAIPTVALVDSDSSSLNVTYPTFGNDNSISSLYYLFFLVSSARLAGRFRRFQLFGLFLLKEIQALLKVFLLRLFKIKLRRVLLFVRSFMYKPYVWYTFQVFLKLFLQKYLKQLKILFLKIKSLKVILSARTILKYRLIVRLISLKKLNVQYRLRKFSGIRKNYRNLKLFFGGYSFGSRKAISSVVALSQRMHYRLFGYPNKR